MQLRCRSDEQPVGQLSGGNQQKVLMGRWLLRGPEMLLLDEPTRGIDVAAKFAVYHLIDDLARQGKGIVVVSSEVEELMLLCDRIAVLSAGRLVRLFVAVNGPRNDCSPRPSRATRNPGPCQEKSTR